MNAAADLLNRVHEAIEDIPEHDLLGAQAVLLTADPYPKFLLKAFVLPPLEDDDTSPMARRPHPLAKSPRR